MSRERSDLPPDLARLQQRFERWRERHIVRTRISKSLWAAAAKSAANHGIYRTARALRVNYYSLKKRIDPDSAGAGELSQGTFLELPPSLTASVGECALEWEDAAGSKMRVHLKGFPASDLAALGRSLWS